MNKHPIHRNNEENLLAGSQLTADLIKENTQKIEENTQAIKDLHNTSKDRSEAVLGFTGTIQKLEQVKSGVLATNQILGRLSKKEVQKVELMGAELVTIKGQKGDRGEKGDKGDSIKGDKGEQGIQGIQGEKGETGQQGERGEKGDKGDTGEQGVQGPKGEQGLSGSPDQPDEIVDKINSAKKKIDPKQIKGLSNLIRDVDNMGKYPQGAMGGGGGDVLSKFFVKDLSSLLNGSTKSFSITQNRIVLDVKCSSFPFVFREGTDYTISGISRETITFTDQIDAVATLASGQTLIITGIMP